MRIKVILAPLDMSNAKVSLTVNDPIYIEMFFVQTSTLPPIMHRQKTKHQMWKVLFATQKPNNENKTKITPHPTKKFVELKNVSPIKHTIKQSKLNTSRAHIGLISYLIAAFPVASTSPCKYISPAGESGISSFHVDFGIEVKNFMRGEI